MDAHYVTIWSPVKMCRHVIAQADRVSQRGGLRTMYDLVISGGTLVDPAQGIHDRRDVAFTGGHVATVAPEIPVEQARQVVNANGMLVVPGLVDAHVHVFEGVS